MFKLIYIIIFSFVMSISMSKASIEELSNNYDECVIECHGKVLQLNITPLIFNDLNKNVAEYLLKRAKIQDTAFDEKNKNIEAYPNLEGEVLVIIGMRNKTTKKYISIIINMNKDYEIILRNEKVNENLKNDFKALIKSLAKK